MKCNRDEIYTNWRVLFTWLLNGENTPENMAQACADENQQPYRVAVTCLPSMTMDSPAVGSCIFRVEAGLASGRGTTYFPKK